MSTLIGLDIGSYSIKLCHVEKSGKKISVESIASAYNPVGYFLPEDESQLKQLAESVKTLLVDKKLMGKPLSVCLPENHVYTSIVEMPPLTSAELSSAIQWEAEQHLPISLNSVNLEFSVIEKADRGTSGKMKVLLVAAKKDLVDRLMSFSELLESDISFLESSSLSLGRSVLQSNSFEQSVLLCHMGALSTDLMILDGVKPVFIHSINTGGLALTRSIEKGLSLQPSQAEEYKRTYGLDTSQLEGKVAQSLMPVYSAIISEIKKSLQFYQSENSNKAVGRIILSGGGAYLPEILSNMTKSLGVEVVVLNPFEKLSISQEVKLPKEIASFSVAVGLSLRESE